MTTEYWIKFPEAISVTKLSRRTLDRIIAVRGVPTSQQGGVTIILASELLRAVQERPQRGGNRRVQT